MPFPLFVLIGLAIAASSMTATLVLSRRRGWAIGAAVVGAAGLLLFHGPVYFRHFPVDDAFIILRYSRNLADGLGPTWNSDVRVEGYTSFLWMALVAGLGKLGLDIVDAARTLIFITQLATILIVLRIWKLWADEHPGSGLDSPAVLAAVLLALAITDGIAFWGFSGMETPLYMALLTGGAYLYFRERRGGTFPWSAIAFAALAMTRPEGIIAAGVTGAFIVAEAFTGSYSRREALTKALSWAGVFLLLYGSYFLWRYTYYDSLLPNTFYAKADPTRAVFDRGIHYVFAGALNYHLLAMFAGTAVLLGVRRLRGDAAYVLVLSTLMLAGIAVEGGDSFGHGRFVVPLLPLLYLGGLAGFATLLKLLRLEPLQRGLVAAGVLGVGALMLFFGSNNPFLPEDREDHVERRVLGTWLNEHTPPDYTIAAFAVGSLGYYSERNILDMLGLNDRVIARAKVPNFGTGLAGHEKYDVDYVLDVVRPEIIVTRDADLGPLSTEQLRAMTRRGGGLPAVSALMTDPRLWLRYEVRSVNVDGRWFNFLQRKDTLARFQPAGYAGVFSR